MPRPSPQRHRLPRGRYAAALLVLAGGLLASCGGEKPEEEKSPADVLAEAKQTLDDTSGVHVSLSSSDLPSGVTGVAAAEGIATHAPAFEGSIQVVLTGTSFEVPLISVDGTVWAQLPLTSRWDDIDPAEYNAPDPARLLSPEDGFSSILPRTEELEEGESVRGGEDNDEILTEYSGTVPGEAVTGIIPSASGDFAATYTVTDDGELRQMVLTGVFYPDAEEMTYTVDLADYGTEKDITAP